VGLQKSVNQLYFDLKIEYNSVRKEISDNVIIEFGILRNLGGLVKCVQMNSTVQFV
jgi:hypothetical protein